MSKENGDPEYQLLMPFVATESNGGAYDDLAYVAGYELGVVDGQLSGDQLGTAERPRPATATSWRWIRQGNREQFDLIAMKYGRVAEFGETWEDLITARIRPVDGDDE